MSYRSKNLWHNQYCFEAYFGKDRYYETATMPAQIHTSLLLISISLCNIFFGKLVSTYHRASADKCQRLFTIFRASSFRRQVFFSFCLHLIPDRRMIHPCSSTIQTTSSVSCFFAAQCNTFRSVGVAKFGGGAIRPKNPEPNLCRVCPNNILFCTSIYIGIRSAVSRHTTTRTQKVDGVGAQTH